MDAGRILGLILALALICGKGRTESAILEGGQDQTSRTSGNAFSIQIPLGGGNVIQSDTEVSPQRRLSLEDFFLNRNGQQQQAQPEVQQQAPVAQFQVQQPDPNTLFLVRDAQFPSTSGGLISRILMMRRMLRLRRIARRLTILPRLLGLGLRQTLQRSDLGGNQSPLTLFANRIGEAYNPRDFVFGNKAFSYNNNNNTSDNRQQDSNTDQLQQQTRGIPREANPYYDGASDSQYDLLDNSNIRAIDNYDSQELNHLVQQNPLKGLTDEQQLLLLQQLQNYQHQLNQIQQHLNNQQGSNANLQNYQNQEQNANLQNYQNQEQNADLQKLQYRQPQQNYHHVQTDNNQIHQNQLQQQPQSLNEQQLEQYRQLELQLAREQLIQQQLQQLQLAQQAQNLKQHQDLASLEQEQNYHNQNSLQQLTHNQDINTVGDRTEGSPFSPVGIGNSVGGGKAGGASVGVGINVGLKPPGIDIQVTKPVGPVINPIQPIVHKPVPIVPVQEPLVPLGILPKPILNLKGRLFFGAEMGKGVGVKAGLGR